jgi:hypothetical protein
MFSHSVSSDILILNVTGVSSYKIHGAWFATLVLKSKSSVAQLETWPKCKQSRAFHAI